MNINKNNYEAYFLDYHEGNLTPQEVADVLLFVQNHPELKEELESFENFSIKDYPTILFENKADLKKKITEANREEYFIKAVENILTPAEKQLLDDYIKQHPHVIVDYHLFQQTKLQANTSIVFENKDRIKKVLTPVLLPFDKLRVTERNEALISYAEGLLSEEEEEVLTRQIATDVQLQKELALYQQTKLVADTAIVFENKNDLKRKERKVIPLYYYMDAAAAILLLIGLFFIFNNNKGEQFAKNNVPTKSNHVATNVPLESADKTNTIEPKNNNHSVPSNLSGLVAKKTKHIQENITNSITVEIVKNEPEIIKKEEPPIAETNALTSSATGNQEPISKNQEPASDIGLRTSDPNEFLSLKEIAVKKLKENTLDENTLEAEKKSGRLKKFSGWDLAKLVAKGVSKVTGREVKVEPKYNDNGDVTAYALGAGGFELSRGR